MFLVKAEEISRSCLNMPFFSSLCPPPLKVGLVDLLCEKVKHYPILYDQQMKRYGEKERCSKQCEECGGRGPRINRKWQ